MMELFFTFVKIGLFTFGGGYAMISMIENNTVDYLQTGDKDNYQNVKIL